MKRLPIVDDDVESSAVARARLADDQLGPYGDEQRRRGVITLLTAVLLVFLLGIIALSVDLGYIFLARTQLQVAADSAALATAATMGNSQDVSTQAGIKFGGLNKVGNRPVQIQTSDIVYGTWDTSRRTFTPSQSGMANAVKVTARADSTTSGQVPLFFSQIFGQSSVTCQASAVATTNPRDICFVVDLSGSMNDDTDPNKTSSIDGSYPGVGTQMMKNIFSDFGFGTYPGSSQKIGQPLGVTTLSGLTSTTSSPLLNTKQPVTLKVGSTNYSYTVPSQYQIKSTDSSSTRTKKAYSWVMDMQLRGVSGFAPLPGIMPAAKPTPNSADSNNYNYWQSYLSSNSSNIGYLSYLAAIETCGRDVKPFSSSTLYSPLSINSPDCPYHAESTDGGTFNFPPREMPTHCARRAIISAIQVIKDRNQSITDSTQQDWVSMVTYELTTHAVVAHNLDDQYAAAMQACCQLQACSDSAACTSTDTGLMTAINLLNTQGRLGANKVVVLMTDGKPNLNSSSNSTISSYESAHANSNFYGGSSNYPQDAAMMQVSIMQRANWTFFPVEIGLQGDADFMNRIYSTGKGKTTQTDTSPYAATGNPTLYETELKTIFQQIISAPKIRIVQ
jgi:Flp pilus assembly protein TadG